MRKSVLLAAVVALLAAGPLLAGFAGTDVFLPMVGRQAGVGTSNWYTTVWIHNPGNAAATATVWLLERGTSNPTPPSIDILVAPGGTEKLDDVVDGFFHVQIFGAMRVTCPTQRLVVTSRVYSQAVGTAQRDSMGQDVAGVPASFAIGLGERAQILGVHQTIPAADSEFRYNFGFVETTGNAATVRIRVLDANGSEQGWKDLQVLRFSQRQVAFKDHFPALSTENFRLEAEVISGSGKVIAYGSAIANASQDPTTFEMEYPARVLAENVAPGITCVTAGDGLTGGGTSGDVTLKVVSGPGIAVGADSVSLADGGVQPVHIQPSAVAGQVLTTVASGSPAPGDGAMALAGTAVAWQTPAAGDITAVNPGTGLTGGGVSGDVTVGIANQGVSTAQLADAAVTDQKVATGIAYSKLTGAPTALPPNGAAGGSLSGTYPNPGIADNAVNSAKIQDSQVGTNDLADAAVTDLKVANGIAYSKLTGAPTALPPSGAAGGSLSGTYPNPGIADAAVTKGKLGAAGGTSGQVLGTNGAALQWLTPANGDITAVTTAAGSGLQGGAASGEANVSITERGITTSMLAFDAVNTSRIADGAVSSDDVGFNYAGSAAKGGAANDLACADCVSGSEVQFNYAAAASEGGAANDLACTNCVAATEVQFNYAASASEGGAATDLTCLSCVAPGEIGSLGAHTGWVLKYNSDSGVNWAADAGLVLPAFPSASSTVGNDIFTVTNTGSGRAFHAVATGDTAIWAQSTSGIGIDARSSTNVAISASSTSADGVVGSTQGTEKAGVHGTAGSNGYGVRGEATNSLGVWGSSTTGTGVWATTSGGFTALWASNPAGSNAGYFSGNATVSGTLTKGGGAFRIDHPLDPEHKVLQHSFVESPDMKNIYDGTVVTDEQGLATVTLPEWFEALNRDFRYQLTVLGGGDVWAHARVARKLAANAFVIQTSAPRTEVSWQVTGIRQDAWADAHRIKVEEEKPEVEQGSYLHPELFGQPEEKGVEWARNPEMMREIEKVREKRAAERSQQPPAAP